jgi:hypothetical protein
MVAMKYHVTATRSGRWWSLQCQEFPAALSQVTRLDQAEDNMREAIAFVAQVPESEIQIEVLPEVPAEFTKLLQTSEHARKEAARAAAEASASSRAAARVLSQAGLPLRDIGTIMGISHQRAAQLLKPA